MRGKNPHHSSCLLPKVYLIKKAKYHKWSSHCTRFIILNYSVNMHILYYFWISKCSLTFCNWFYTEHMLICWIFAHQASFPPSAHIRYQTKQRSNIRKKGGNKSIFSHNSSTLCHSTPTDLWMCYLSQLDNGNGWLIPNPEAWIDRFTKGGIKAVD